MKSSLGAKTLAYPTPVWVVCSFDNDGKANGATVAWGGVCCSKPPAVTISLRKATYSYGCIATRKAFTVSIPSVSQVREADYFGIYSGRDEDKFAACGLTAVTSDVVDAPYIDEFPLILECKLILTQELGLHTMFVGEIIDVKAEESCVDSAGNLDMAQIRPLVYAVGTRAYHAIGERLGEAYALGKKP